MPDNDTDPDTTAQDGTVQDPGAGEEPAKAPHEREWPKGWHGLFLHSLGLIPDVSSACRVARISRGTAYRARDGEVVTKHGERVRIGIIPGFKEAWEEALANARDRVEQVVHTWITTGVPVRSVTTKTRRKIGEGGVLLEEITERFETESAERSATLAKFWLMAWHPGRYRWADRVEATGAGGGPIQVESLNQIDAQIAALSAELEARAAGAPVPDEPAAG